MVFEVWTGSTAVGRERGKPMVEGLIEVESPPNSAGRRGRVASHDWGRIAEELKLRPHRWFLARNIPSNLVPRLRERYPDIEFLGHNRHSQEAGDGRRYTVCDVYVSWPKGATDE